MELLFSFIKTKAIPRLIHLFHLKIPALELSPPSSGKRSAFDLFLSTPIKREAPRPCFIFLLKVFGVSGDFFKNPLTGVKGQSPLPSPRRLPLDNSASCYYTERVKSVSGRSEILHWW